MRLPGGLGHGTVLPEPGDLELRESLPGRFFVFAVLRLADPEHPRQRPYAGALLQEQRCEGAELVTGHLFRRAKKRLNRPHPLETEEDVAPHGLQTIARRRVELDICPVRRRAVLPMVHRESRDARERQPDDGSQPDGAVASEGVHRFRWARSLDKPVGRRAPWGRRRLNFRLKRLIGAVICPFSEESSICSRTACGVPSGLPRFECPV